MRVAVLGAGSLGSLLAGMLAQVQTAEVLIHGKGEHGAMMVAKGLHIEGEATFHLHKMQPCLHWKRLVYPPP